MPMLTYERSTNYAGVEDTKAHIVAHLSSLASATDDPDEYADRVEITAKESASGVLLVGELDGDDIQIRAAYLSLKFDPDADAIINPLSVASQDSQPDAEEHNERSQG